MKKLVFLIACAAFLLAGQVAKAQISVGVGAGSRGYTMRLADVAEGHAAVQLSLEAEASFRLAGNFAASAGLSLTGVAGFHFGGTSKNLGEIYLDLPLRAKYYFPLSQKLDLYLFAGPVVSVDIVSLDAHSKSSSSNFQTYPTLGRLDVMMGGGLGMEILKEFRITIGYDYGLLDRDSSTGATVHTGALKATVGYMF